MGKTVRNAPVWVGDCDEDDKGLHGIRHVDKKHQKVKVSDGKWHSGVHTADKILNGKATGLDWQDEGPKKSAFKKQCKRLRAKRIRNSKNEE